MANLEKKDFIEKVTEKIDDKDLQMELLEDITDSFADKEKETVSKEEFDAVVAEKENLKNKYDELQNKYISRFSTISPSELSKDMLKPTDEVKESKVIDVRSIF